MKKNYLFLAAAATMFTACVQTDVVNDIPEPQQQAISFDAFANKTTRAEITNTSDLQSDDGGFHVWGYKKRGTEDEYTVFNNVPVSWVAASGNVSAHWGYSDPQYWDQTATYQFYAAAPKSSNYSISNKLITVNNVASGKSTDVTDYLIDRDGVTNVSGALKSPVQFTFNHIMAKLSFKFKAGVNETITITSLKMTGWKKGTGTFTQTATVVPTTVANTEWEITSSDIANDNECIIVDENNTDTYIENVTNGNPVEGGYSYIMVPQTITHVPYAAAGTDNSGAPTAEVLESGLTFTISYKIGNEVFKNQVGILPTTQVWGTDTHTTYTIIVSPTKIEFGNPTIVNWSVEDTDGDGNNQINTENKLPL